MTIQTDDFDVQDCGTIILLRAVSSAASEWASEYLPDDCARFGEAYAIERRYFEPIYYGIVEDGLSIS